MDLELDIVNDPMQEAQPSEAYLPFVPPDVGAMLMHLASGRIFPSPLIVQKSRLFLGMGQVEVQREIRAQSRLQVFAYFRDHYRPIAALRCSCKDLAQAQWLVSRADFGRFVVKIFTDRMASSRIEYLIDHDTDLWLQHYSKDNKTMKRVASMVLTPLPAKKNYSAMPLKIEMRRVQAETSDGRVLNIDSAVASKVCTDLKAQSLLEKAHVLKARHGTHVLNSPVVALLEASNKIARLFFMDELVKKQIKPDEVDLTPGYPFEAPDGTLIAMKQLVVIRHKSKPSATLLDMTKYKRRTVKTWVENRNKVLKIQLKKKRQVKKRLHVMRKVEGYPQIEKLYPKRVRGPSIDDNVIDLVDY